MAINAAIGINSEGMDLSKQNIDELVLELKEVIKEMEDNTQTLLGAWNGDSADTFAKASYSLGMTLSNHMLDLQEMGNHLIGAKNQMVETDLRLSIGINQRGEE